MYIFFAFSGPLSSNGYSGNADKGENMAVPDITVQRQRALTTLCEPKVRGVLTGFFNDEP